MGLTMKLYEQIAENIIESIHSHKYGNNKIPTERELCQKYNVSRQTIRKALLICEENGLIDKRQGSGIYLSSSFQRTMNQCVIIVPDKEEYIYPEIITNLEKNLSTINFTLKIYESHDSNIKEKKILEDLLKINVNTLIVTSSRNNLPTPNEDLYNKMLKKKTKIVFLGNPYPNLHNVSYIKFDDYYSGYSLAKRIKSNEQNWCAIFLTDDRRCIDRYYGFIQCMADNDYIYNENNIHWITHSDLLEIRYNNNINCIKKILSKYENTPNIFICGQDEIAYSTIIQLKNTRKLNDEIEFFSFLSSYLKNILDVRLHSYEVDQSLLYTKIIEMILTESKKEKEVLTLPSSLNY